MRQTIVNFASLENFVPFPFLSGGHSQTIIGHYWHSHAFPENSKLVQIAVDPNDKLAVRYFERSNEFVVLLFHGLGSDTRADYMRRNAHWILENGYSCVMINHRGHGEGDGLAEEITHAGRWKDAEKVVEWAREKWPKAKIAAVGFSMSGSLMLNLAAAPEAKTLPDYVISINAPLNLEQAAINLSQGFSRIYDLRFQAKLRKKMGADLVVPRFSTVLDFDELYTAPKSGFKNRDEYYSRSSMYQRMAEIRVPALVLTAKNDPISDFRDYKDSSFNSLVQGYFTESGGHMGYLASRPTRLGTRHWMDYFIDYSLRQLADN